MPGGKGRWVESTTDLEVYAAEDNVYAHCDEITGRDG